jgi:hypothetical protein
VCFRLINIFLFAENAYGEIPTQSYLRNIPQQELSNCDTESLPTFYGVKTPTQLSQGQTDSVENCNASPSQHHVFSWAPTSPLLPRHAAARGTTKKKASPTIEQELVPTTEQELVPTTEQDLIPTTTLKPLPITAGTIVPTAEQKMMRSVEGKPGPIPEIEFFRELMPTAAQQFDHKNR